CNVNAWLKAKPEWAKGSRLIRFTPRFNPAVHGYWMCDIGRFEYHWIEGDTRLHKPLERSAAGAFNPVTSRELTVKLCEPLAAAARYGVEPGPEGSLGDVEWGLGARRRGVLPLLIVQGVLLTEIARAADFVLPGASFVEKEASYTNEHGRLQGTARAMAPPGDALDDWQIVVNLATALGVPFDYVTAAHVRADIAARFGDAAGLHGLTTLAFARP